MEARHNLPLDVLRFLFEFSASTSFESAKVLSLTSKEVQLWADPYIFEFAQGSHDYTSTASGIPLLERLYMSNASSRIVRARNYVRAVAWERFVLQESIVEKALEYFPNLIHICLWVNLFPLRHQNDDSQRLRFEITQMYPSLRRVTTRLADISRIPQNAFGSPFWMSITHLQVNYAISVSSIDSPFQLPLFVTMSSLTHLALSCLNQYCELNDDLAVSRVKETFPSSLTLCLLSLVAPPGVDRSHWLANLVTVSRKVDERIVMWSLVSKDKTDEIVVTNGGLTYGSWRKLQNELPTYWEAGETVLKRRQERVCAA
ncbi:hypothetical protein DL96DRAFT_1020969 [Flagelloscypha sp. PMI_526]|nr:hypothetical protein DL96DRAFT_1020969 [Flagelloscypha sp. PMI_526]